MTLQNVFRYRFIISVISNVAFAQPIQHATRMYMTTGIMTIPHEWRVKSVNSPRESNKIVSLELRSRETIFLLSLGELTDFTRHEL